VSQLPVVRAEPPVTAGEVVGSVDEKTLLDALFRGTASLADRVEKHMSPPLPIIGSGEAVTEAVAALGSADALLVHVDGKPAGVVTRQDVLGHLTELTHTVGARRTPERAAQTAPATEERNEGGVEPWIA
jgi:cystathionine beta-synthase